MRYDTGRTNDQRDGMQDGLASNGMATVRDAAETVKDKAKALTRDGKPVEAGQQEGEITKRIENVTTRFSSGTFLGLAVASMAVSASLHFFGQKQNAQFIGQWVPTILTLGLYNKLVKLEGSE